MISLLLRLQTLTSLQDADTCPLTGILIMKADEATKVRALQKNHEYAESWDLNSHPSDICLTDRQLWLQGSPHLCQEKQGS